MDGLAGGGEKSGGVNCLSFLAGQVFRQDWISFSLPGNKMKSQEVEGPAALTLAVPVGAGRVRSNSFMGTGLQKK